MSNEPVSIILPTFNASRFIAETIQSVQRQSYLDWELLVIDDCSTDRTLEIVNEFAASDSRIQIIRLPENSGGPARPRNEGVKSANYKWIAFLDADDIWHTEKLALQMKETESASFLCSQMVSFKDSCNIAPVKLNPLIKKRINFISQSFRAKIPNSSVLILRKLLLDHPFNENSYYRAVEDYDCWLRILKSGTECTKIQSPLLYYRISAEQISKSKLAMIKKVFFVHRNIPGRNIFSAAIFSSTHVFGGIFKKVLLRGKM